MLQVYALAVWLCLLGGIAWLRKLRGAEWSTVWGVRVTACWLVFSVAYKLIHEPTPYNVLVGIGVLWTLGALLYLVQRGVLP